MNADQPTETTATQVPQPPISGEGAGFSAVAGSEPLAERCFASDRVSDELFDTVNAILGCDTKRCLEDGFAWAVDDTRWDYYDTSIEVIRPDGSEWMNPEQAVKIQALGFSRIYESMGDECSLWMGSQVWRGCSPREANEVSRLRATIAALLRAQNTKPRNLGPTAPDQQDKTS